MGIDILETRIVPFVTVTGVPSVEQKKTAAEAVQKKWLVLLDLPTCKMPRKKNRDKLPGRKGCSDSYKLKTYHSFSVLWGVRVQLLKCAAL